MSFNILAAFEAILFASGESVSSDDLCMALETSKEEIENLALSLGEKYRESGIQLLRVGDDFQLSSKKEYYEYIRRVTEPKRSAPLSHAALEALSIIAYKQPITRSQIDYIRGVDSSSSMSRLISCGLVEAKGTLDAPGRPSLYYTTKEFLRCFGLENLNELPELGELEKTIETEEFDQTALDMSDFSENEEIKISE
ncbi:MAG: SMC-Scp complex subunit ScpB [Bacillota bacterium]|nr:SMC-Scp complex subunit ScpB [Bacillota bacterium]